MDERTAIELLRHGDIAGLEVLVKSHQVRALRAAFLITGDYQLSEDLVQGAFLRAFDRIHQFDPNRSFGPWFLRSVINDARKAATHRNRHSSLDRLNGQFGEIRTALRKRENSNVDVVRL